MSTSLPVHTAVKLKPLALGMDESREDVHLNGKAVFLHDVSQRRSAAPKEYLVDSAHPPLATNEDLYSHDVEMVLDAVSKGVDGLVLVLGTEGSGRHTTVQGQGGLIWSSLLGLQAMLADRKQDADHAGLIKYECTLKARCCKVVNEKVRDVLSPNAAVLPRIEETPEGVALSGVSAVSVGWDSVVRIAEEIIAKLDQQLRIDGVNGQGAGSTAARETTVVIYEVAQSETVLATNAKKILFSRFMLISAQAVDCLVEDRDVVQMKNGFNAFRSAFGLKDLASIASEGPKGLMDCGSSALTLLLKEVLIGGSVVCSVIACIQQLQKDKTEQVLDIVKKLGSLSTNPVPMESRLIGLVRALRAQLLLASRASQIGNTNDTEPRANAEAMERALRQIEGELLQEKLERVKAVDERNYLNKRVEDIKEKYKSAMGEQIALQKELLETEEMRVELSQAVVTLQAKLLDLETCGSDQKYDYIEHVTKLEKELKSVREQLEIKTTENDQLLDAKLNAQRRTDNLEIELKKANQVLNDAQVKLTAEFDKGELLASELVRLSQAKLEIQSQLEEITDSRRELVAEKDFLERRISESRQIITELEAKLSTAVLSLENERKSVSFLSVEREKLKLEFEGEKSAVQKKADESVRARLEDGEAQVFRFKQQAEEAKAAANAAMEEREEFSKELRTLRRQLHESQDLLRQTKTYGNELSAQLEKARAEQSSLRSQAQQSLVDALESQPPGANARMVDEALSKLVDFANKSARREKELILEISKFEKACQFLQERFTWLFHLARDWVPQKRSPEMDKAIEEMTDAMDKVAVIVVSSGMVDYSKCRPSIDQKPANESSSTVLSSSDLVNRGSKSDSLQKKCALLEQAVSDLEAERSALLVRATVAEEQLAILKARLSGEIRGRSLTGGTSSISLIK